MKLYFSVIGLIVAVMAVVGLVLPYLISSQSTELVLLGVGLGILFIPTTVWYVKKFIFSSSKQEKV
jgi:hypothetical protein